MGPELRPARCPAGRHTTRTAPIPARPEPRTATIQRFTPGEKVAADWWRIFQCARLDAIVGEALADNPGLAAAQASLRESEDKLRSGYGIFYPDIGAGAAATRQRYLPEKLGQSGPANVFNLFTLSASVSYALDVFGGERRLLEGLRAQVDLERATEQATYLTLVANIVNTVVARAAYRAEVDATKALIELQRQQVNLAEVQFKAGTVPYSNVLVLRSQLASNEAIIPQLEQRLTQSDDLLATLLGHVPAEWSPPEIALTDLTLPADLPVSLPADLVRQRPDILIAEATAHAASANVGVATAALLPGITLNGGYSANGTQTGNLMAAGGRAWNLGANLTTPVFEGGTLWYKRKGAIEEYHQAAALYRQVVLGAFGQVADTLRALDHDAATLQAQDEALSSAREALHLIETNYEAGLNTYFDVLAADAQYHQAVINELQASAVRYQDTVALYVALGGGWWSQAPQGMPTAASFVAH